MFLTIEPTSDLTGYIISAFQRYRTALIAIHKQQWKDEDIRGESVQQYTAAQYQMAIRLTILVRLDVNRLAWKELDWDYFVTTWNLVEFKQRLACTDISLDNLLNDFALPVVNGSFNEQAIDGIEDMEVEMSFEVEPDTAEEIIDPTIGTVILTEIDMEEAFSTIQGCDELTCSINN